LLDLRLVHREDGQGRTLLRGAAGDMQRHQECFQGAI
jgi:hypothetical protein